MNKFLAKVQTPPSFLSEFFVADIYDKYALIYVNLKQQFLSWKRPPTPFGHLLKGNQIYDQNLRRNRPFRIKKIAAFFLDQE